MTRTIVYWDSASSQQKSRPATQDEQAEFDAAQASPPTRDELKRQRQSAVDAITVEVEGMVFDGDEASQERMARALKVAEITGIESCVWVLHDNTAANVTKNHLAQALALAMQAQGEIWVLPYESP